MHVVYGALATGLLGTCAFEAMIYAGATASYYIKKREFNRTIQGNPQPWLPGMEPKFPPIFEYRKALGV